MFNEEEEWSDDQEAQTVLKHTQKAKTNTDTKAKVVGKKSLLRTLQTLGSVPEWKNDDHQQDSDSETEAAPIQAKKKKKRRKKRKHAETSEEQQENGDLDQSVTEEQPVAKKKNKGNKLGTSKVKPMSADTETKDKEITKTAKNNINTPNDTGKLSRQQWKNKMKNKRKCKNKYQQNKPEERIENNAESLDKHKAKAEVQTVLHNNNNNSGKITQTAAQKKQKETERRPQKKAEKSIDVSYASEIQTQKDEKQLTAKQKKTKGGKDEKSTTKSSADGREPEVQIKGDQQPLHTKTPKTELSKEQSAKRDRLRKMLSSKGPDQKVNPVEPVEEPVEELVEEPAAPVEEVKLDRSASLRSRMEQRLESARFRYINEVLYTTSSGEAKRMFNQDPEVFWIYHRGYTAQVQRWPNNPVDAIITYIRQKPSSLVVADFGCGDCKIARSVKNKVHSFDLAAACELVTVCDMANVPLRDSSVDIAVFCLSLMGINLADFLAEANRVLKMGGILKVAEVASRFDNVRSFINALAGLGFKMVSKNTEDTHFYAFEFVKNKDAPENIKKYGLQLKACVYKKR